ncbi:MAG: hypothetical protein Q4A32_11735 [Lachnospiraceae bacterium]|nr:hypothetical protein [Lachnospiraceae bacterium]
MADRHGEKGSVDFEQYYADMPGQYIDEVLSSELPGSHMDYLLYGELPGSHLDVVLKSPLPGGSTDEILSAPLPGTIPDFGTADIHKHSRKKSSSESRRGSYAYNYAARQADRYAASRSDDYAIGSSDNYAADSSDTYFGSFLGGEPAEKRDKAKKTTGKSSQPSVSSPGTSEAVSELKNMLLGGVSAANATLASTGSSFARAKNSSKYVQKEIRKEKPKRKRGALSVFVTIIILLSVLNRLIVPIVEQISEKIKPQETTVEDELHLTDSELGSFVDVWNGISRQSDSWGDFNLSDQELVEKYQSHGYVMNIDAEEGDVYGSYNGEDTRAQIYRTDEYLSYSCGSDSDMVDLATIEKGTAGIMPRYVSEILGRDISDVGIDEEMLDKFQKAGSDTGYATYRAENFFIYYYEYEDFMDFYLYGNDGKAYISINKEGGWIQQISLLN